MAEQKSGLSNVEKVALLGLGAFAVGQLLKNGDRVVSNSGDRVVVEGSDGYRVLKNDDVLLRQPGSDLRTETYSDGSTRSYVTNPDGSQVVTVRAADGRVLRRTRILPGGQEVRLSKRAGAMVTLEDLVDEVGVDAARYTLIRYPADSPLTMDLDLLVQRTNDNPVYYVQYAHARISSVLRNAADLGIDWRTAEFDPGLLEHERESALLGVLAEFPRIIATAAELREPHRVARYLEEVATAYHKFYDSCRVLPRNDEELAPLHIARLWLCAASRQVVANGLDLCGVQAPERM